MLSKQILLLLLFAVVLVGILLYFFIKHRNLKLKHLYKTDSIRHSILLNKNQMTYRDKGLLEYSFIKYNLDESLRVQLDIKMI